MNWTVGLKTDDVEKQYENEENRRESTTSFTCDSCWAKIWLSNFRTEQVNFVSCGNCGHMHVNPYNRPR